MYKTKNTASGDILSYYSADNAADYSIERIKQEIDNSPVINPRYRLHILNADETVKEDIPEDDIISGGSYSENYQNGQRRSLSFSLYNFHKKYTPSINGLWTGVKLNLELGLQIDGAVIWFPKGTYAITNITSSHKQGETNVSVEASDKFSILEGADGLLDTSYTIPVGSEIHEVIRDLLKTPKGNGEPLDPLDIIYHSAFKGKTTQATITKETGDTVGSIILDLATQLNAEVFYDIEGHLNVIPINSVTDDQDKTIIYHFYDELGGMEGLDLSFDLSGVINRVIVIGSTNNGETYRAVAVNDNPGSPLCYQRIGYRTASPISDSNITSQILAQERADYELRQKLIVKSSSTVTVRYNPLLLVNNLITITDDFYGLNQVRFLVQGISLALDYSGAMSLTISNIQNFMFLTTGR
nr:MAG TPA: tail protein [Caudoviricetes sp.]